MKKFLLLTLISVLAFADTGVKRGSFNLTPPVVSVTGTAKRIINTGTAQAPILSTPQDLDSTSKPKFQYVIIGGYDTLNAEFFANLRSLTGGFVGGEISYYYDSTAINWWRLTDYLLRTDSTWLATHSYITLLLNNYAKKDSVLNSYVETDPSVYAWAKGASKPSYTRSEIGLGTGAMWDSTEFKLRLAGIYASIASLSSYALTSSIPTTLPASDVYAWAKAASKPSYSRLELGLNNMVYVDSAAYYEKIKRMAVDSINAAGIGVNGSAGKVAYWVSDDSLGWTTGTGTVEATDTVSLSNRINTKQPLVSTVTIDSTYGIRLSGGATAWDDMQVPLTQGRQGATDKPAFDYTNVGYSFIKDSTEIIYGTSELPHGWKLSSNLSPHIHCQQTSATDTAVFMLKWKWHNLGSVLDANWKYTILGTRAYAYPGSGTIQQLVYGAPLDATGKTLSSVLVYELKRRNGTGSATSICVYNLGFHYEVDGFGSESTTSKDSAVVVIPETPSDSGVVATDDFNRATATPLGGSWTNWGAYYWYGYGGIDISLSATGTGYEYATWNANTFADNQYSQVKINNTAASDKVGVLVRATSNSGYYMIAGPDTSKGVEVGKIVNGTRTTLFTAANPFFAKNDIAKLSVVGTTLYWFKNGVCIGSIVDTSLSSGSPGVAGYNQQGGGELDDWEGGNL